MREASARDAGDTHATGSTDVASRALPACDASERQKTAASRQQKIVRQFASLKRPKLTNDPPPEAEPQPEADPPPEADPRTRKTDPWRAKPIHGSWNTASQARNSAWLAWSPN
jgi:hypothetical protein